MKANHNGRPDQELDLSALRRRIEAAADAGGTIFSSGDLLDLLGAAAEHADGQTVPAELLVRAVRLALGASPQPIVQVDCVTAGALVDLAEGHMPTGELIELPGDEALGLIA